MWINIKDGFPDNGKPLLVILDDYTFMVAEYFYVSEEMCGFARVTDSSGSEVLYDDQYNVLAWCYLPEFPNQEVLEEQKEYWNYVH